MSTQAIDSPIAELNRRKGSVRARIGGQVTIWLGLAMLIGASIALYDGVHRKWMTELETLGPASALTYTANKAAWVFAAIALPLVLSHGRKLRFTVIESLVLWFVLCTVAYTRDFAYLKIPRVPVYVTDVILVLALVGCFAWPRLRLPRSRIAVLLAGFLALGIFDAVRGLRQDVLVTDVLRDFSVPVYALFALPALYARRTKAFAEQLALMIVCGALISTLIGMGWYAMQPGMRRYVVMGMYLPLALVWAAVASGTKKLSPRAGVLLVAVLAVGAVLCNARSVYVGLAAGYAALLLTGFGSARTKVALKVAMVVCCVMAVVATARLRANENAQWNGKDPFAVTALQQHIDDNTQWRVLLWKEAARRFVEHPLFGEGFGVPLTFSLSATDTKPHNIYLYAFYKMGLVGGAIFLFLLIAPTVAAWRAIRSNSESPDRNLLRGLFACQIFLLCWGALDPLIETPFLASIFWLNLGILLRMSGRMKSSEKAIAAAATT